MEPIRVLVADDHPVVRQGVRGLLDSEPGMEVVGEAKDGVEAVAMYHALQPDVLLLDLVMPRKDGIGTITEIMRSAPSARILVLTSFAEDERVFSAVKAGAMGYLLKDSSPAELLGAVRAVADGGSPLPPTIARKLVRELSRPAELPPEDDALTIREREVLSLIAGGMSNQAIADTLIVSERTVRSHVSSILHKLHLSSRTQAALYATRKGVPESGRAPRAGKAHDRLGSTK